MKKSLSLRQFLPLLLLLFGNWGYGQRIAKIAYFIDTNPGLGQSDTFVFSPSDSLSASFTLPNKGLSIGNHIAFISVLDASGLWGPYQSHVFTVVDSTPSKSINQMEYAIDKDPGIGKATNISFTNGDSISKLFTHSTNGMSEGQHFIHVRTKLIQGLWSPWQMQLFYIEDTVNVGQINQLEYAIDKDPGIGKANNISITSGDSIATLFTHSTNGMSEGQHYIHVRTKVNTGFWSPWQLHLFYIEDTVNTGQINQLEYTIDKDPGVGKANNVSITNGDSLTKFFTHSTNGMSSGQHYIHVRTKVNTGFWSPWQLHMFYIEDTVNVGQINQLEYVIDKDPGVGKANSVGVTSGDSIAQLFTHITNGMTEGQHYIHVRTKVNTGFWSPWQLHQFYIEDTVNAGPINQLEYAIDKDPGVGKANAVSITSGDSISKLFTHSTNGMSSGQHYIHVRTKVNTGFWSPWQLHLFYIGDTQLQNTIISYKSSIDSSLNKLPFVRTFSLSGPTDTVNLLHQEKTDTMLTYGNHIYRIWAQQNTNLSSVWHFDTFAVIDCPMLDTAAIQFSGGFCAGDSLKLLQNITTLGIWPKDSFNFRWTVNSTLISQLDSLLLTSNKADSFLVNFSFTKKSESRCKGELTQLFIFENKTRDSLNKNICQGDSLLVHGKFEKTNGIYVLNTTSAKGCDSTSVVKLIVNTTIFDTLTLAICQGDSIKIHGNFVKTTGLYNFNGKTQFGCDSFVQVQLTVNAKYHRNDSFQLCQGDTLKIHGKKYTSAGTFNDTLKSSKGCDSSFTSVVKINPTFKDSSSQTICAGDSFFIHGKFEKTANRYVFQNKTIKGCDSVFIVNLRVNPSYNTSQNLSICAGDSIKIHGNFIKTSGLYTFTSKTHLGCDSIVKINLTVNPTFFKTDNLQLCQGDTLNIHGKKYFSAGTFIDSFKTKQGCDSIFTTIIKMNPVYKDTIQQNICQGDSAFIHGNFQSTTNTFVFTGKTINGCDSISVVKLKVNQVYNDTLRFSFCQGDSIKIHGSFEKTAGTFINIGHTINNCDSTSTIILSLNPTFLKNENFERCSGDSLQVHGAKYFNAGTFSHPFKSVKGCDSTIITTLKINPIYNQNQKIGLCGGDSYLFDGKTLTQSGNYIGLFKTTKGCDSTINLQLQIDSVIQNDLQVDLCFGDSLFIGGQFRSAAGSYSDTYKASKGCDSIVTQHVSILQQDTTYLNATICHNATFVFNGNTLSKAGTYHAKTKNQRGCDSVLILTLAQRTKNSVSINNTICFGDSAFIGKGFKKGTGNFSDTLIDQFGCDSILLINQTERALDSSSIHVQICPGDSILTGTTFKKGADIFTDIFKNRNGCDSFLFTHVTLKSTSITQLFDTICFNSSLPFFTQTLTAPGVYQHRLPKNNGCDSIIEMHLFRRSQFKPTVVVIGFAALSTDTTYQSYQWYKNRLLIPNATNRTLGLSESGTYDVSVTNNLGCRANSWDNLLGNPTFDLPNMLIYPNPARNSFNLDISTNANVIIYDKNGAKVKVTSAYAGHNEITVDDLAAGIYHVSIWDKNTFINYRIILLK